MCAGVLCRFYYEKEGAGKEARVCRVHQGKRSFSSIHATRMLLVLLSFQGQFSAEGGVLIRACQAKGCAAKCDASKILKMGYPSCVLLLIPCSNVVIAELSSA